MLTLTLHEECIEFRNGFNAEPWSVTRYHGERWEQVGAALLCGIADVFQDVGIVVSGAAASVTLETLRPLATDNDGNRQPMSRWVSIYDEDKGCKAIYSFSDDQGCVLIPDRREAVEDAILWTMWTADEERGFRATAFLGYREFRRRVEAESWNRKADDLVNLVREVCLDKALFQTQSGPGRYRVYPGSIGLSHLVRLAESVMARINTELTD